MVDLNAYQQKLVSQLNEWKQQAELLKDRAEEAGSGIQLELNKHLENLKGLQAEAQSRLMELKSEGEGRASEVKELVEGMVGDVTNTLKAIGQKLKP